MKKILIAFILSLFVVTIFQTGWASANEPTQDSEELRLQDMLMCMLTPNINKVLEKYYGPNTPGVTPWKIKIIETRRVQHFRGFILDITFDIEPTTGHNVSVGKDRMTFRISYGPSIELIEHKHLATYDLPPETSSFDFNKLPPLFKYVLSKPF
ncbi:DUF3888 domain-containing protein [Neobacillus ginsengisoli]|uniref:DUF3888 domain-containing protein n=1 Tax=Neobacillus ginsengisoli TaxID=904295 RepID=A0ABT9XVS2_9BACI|nr:DUF3888 domain-containing protein [Neobacillus ginsengisoli]MDQ0198972.1 hypothetical protein [Neobacillus ginsengisoli]